MGLVLSNSKDEFMFSNLVNYGWVVIESATEKGWVLWSGEDK
jgi:hypothetical protein